MDHQPTIIDVRPTEQYKQEHIPGSTSIPLDELENRISELDKETSVHVVCNRGGQRSQNALKVLKENGFKKADIIEGGMVKWKESNSVD